MEKILDKEEVRALLQYTVNNNIVDSGEEVKALYAHLKDDSLDSSEALTNYAGLVKKTHPVTGKSVLDTQNNTRAKFKGAIVATSIFLVLAIGTECLGIYLSDLVLADEGFWRRMDTIYASVLCYLKPYFWGGVGGCVFLLRRLYTFVQDQSFDSDRLRGWYLRLLLAVILGAIVAEFYRLNPQPEDEATFSASVIAFLAGFSVKVVFNLFEFLIERFASIYKTTKQS